MSTRDENIKDDLLFFNTFYYFRYPDGDESHKKSIIKIIEDGEYQIETFMENTVAALSGAKRMSINGIDLDNGFEVKKVISNFRNNNIRTGQWRNTYEVKNVRTKTGPICVIGLNRYAGNKFEFYHIPRSAYEHVEGKSMSLPIENWSGFIGFTPTPTGIRIGESKWHQYMVKDIVTMSRKGLAGPFPKLHPTVQEYYEKSSPPTTFSQVFDLPSVSKIDPILENTSLYTQEPDQSQNQDLWE